MSPKTIALSTLRCPECGAPARVEPGAQLYVCEFCNTSLVVERSEPTPPPVPPPAASTPPIFRDAARQIELSNARELARVRALAAAREGAGKSRSGCITMLMAIPVLAAVAGVGVTLFKTGALAGLVSWNGKEPLVCSGNEWITVDHVHAKFGEGVVIDASGNCHVSCKDCELSAPTVVRVRENASVHLDHGTADGDVFFESSENGQVSTDHTKSTGKTLTPPDDHSFKPRPWPKSGPFVCGRNAQGGEYDGVKVKVSSGAAIIGSVNCTIKLKHCTIEGPVGILLTDNADIELEDCEVHAETGVVARGNGSVILEGGTFIGTEHAAVLADNADLRAHGTHYQGGNSTTGNATVQVE